MDLKVVSKAKSPTLRGLFEAKIESLQNIRQSKCTILEINRGNNGRNKDVS